MFGFAKRDELLVALRRLEQVEKDLREPIQVPAADLGPLEARVASLELQVGKQHLEALAVMEKVARRLQWREEKRTQVSDDGGGEPGEREPSVARNADRDGVPLPPFRSLRSW
jgi:hypothetical protein